MKNPLLSILPLILFTAVGCGETKTQPVEGKITYQDGTPMLGGGQVIFNPVDPESKTSSRGIIGEDGRFRMGTFADQDGVPIGRYRIAVMPTPPRNFNHPPPGWPPINKKYSDPETSGLEYEVTRDQNVYNPEVAK